MEKEALIEELKTRVGENDFGVLSAQTVDALAATFLPSFADDEKITDDTWKLPIEVCRNYAGQYRHDLATKITEEKNRLEKENENSVKTLAEKQFEEFKAEWEKANKTTPVDNKNNGSKGDTDAVTKALEEYNKKLFGEDGKSGLIGGQLSATSEFIANSKKAAEAEKISTIKQQLKDYLTKERKASREPVVNLAIGGLDIKTDSNIDELKIQVEKIYEGRYKEFYGDGGKPYGGDSAGGKDDGSPDEDVKVYLENKRKADEEKAKKVEAIKKSFV